ncbi:MAG: transcriptional regulator, partial [Cyanobacteria bacterium P01_D01_bin.44]
MTTLNSLIKSETRPPDPVQTDSQLQEQSAAFVNRLLDILNSGALASMLSIGHRTGLLDTMATLPPVTSQEIAEAAGLNERYVREWLGAMVTGRIVTYDSATQTYHLPTPHAAFLIR